MNARVIPLHPGPGPEPGVPAPAIGADDLRRALGRDLALAFKALDIESVRVFTVGLPTASSDAAWGVAGHAEFSGDAPQRRLDRALPGAPHLVEQLAESGLETVLSHKLGHRRWAHAWRLDDRSGVVAEACYRDGRAPPNPVDGVLVRLICDAGLRPGGNERAAGPPSRPALEWPPRAPRRSRRARLDRRSRIGLSLIALSALAGAMLSLAAAPFAADSAAAVEAEVAHWRRTADRSMQRSLSVALASGDYGEVQEALGGLSTSGYFRSALVTNAGERVVAQVGPVAGQQIGNEVLDAIARTARPLPLALGSQALGKVLVVSEAEGATGASSAAGLTLVRLLAALAALAAAGAGLVLAWPRLRRRHVTSP